MALDILADSKSDITWYSDPSGEIGAAKLKLKEMESVAQPWKSYWPPKDQAMLDSWLASEFPQVLSWSFDRKQPFDRPWRAWARSSRANEEERGLERWKRQIIEDARYHTGSGNNEASRILSHQNALAAIFTANEPIENTNENAIVRAHFHFFVPLNIYNEQKPYLSRLPCGTGLPRTNIVTASRELNVTDISGYESLFTLQKSGFQFAKYPINTRQWTESFVLSEYIPRTEKWLAQYLKCSRVFIYAYSFREPGLRKSRGASTKSPFLRAHCDATAASCFKRLKLHFPDDAHKMMEGRVRFLNVWRNISPPGQECDCPLALCDYRTINRDDLIPADMIFPHYEDEAYEVLYNSKQQWFYKKNMDQNDVLLFKLSDNSPDEAKLCPHSAFMDPSVAVGTPGRVSIEVRSIIIG